MMGKSSENARPGMTPRKAASLFSASLLASTVLLDQSVAVVGHRVITLSEVRGEAIITFILEKGNTPPMPESIPSEKIDRALQTLIRRVLIDNYLDKLGLVPEVPAERKAKLKNSIKPFLTSIDLSEATLDQLLTSRIRSEMFAESHLPFRVNVTDEEVRSYYEAEKDHKFLRKPFESVAPIVRADLRGEKVKKELEKWLDTEMHRTEVVLLNR